MISAWRNIRKLPHRLRHWQYAGLCLLVLVTLGFHFAMIASSKSLVFDENYYVPDARSIIANQSTLTPEQTPMGKLFIIAGMKIFGDNPLGWRFFSVVFGEISIVFLYLICRRLKMSNRAALIAAFLFSFENLNFLQSCIAMLDVYAVTCLIAAIFFFLRRNLILAGLLAGLSALAKLPSIFVLGIFFIYWLVTERRRWQLFVIPALTALVSFVVLLPVFDFFITSHISDPIQRIQYVLNYAKQLNFTALKGNFMGVVSRPWDWLVNRGTIFASYNPQQVFMVSFTISALFLAVVVYLIYKTLKTDRGALVSLSWLISLYLPWILISLVFGRLTYVYYMYPVVGAVCIGIGLGLSNILDWWEDNVKGRFRNTAGIVVISYLALHLAIFLMLSSLLPPLGKWL